MIREFQRKLNEVNQRITNLNNRHAALYGQEHDLSIVKQLHVINGQLWELSFEVDWLQSMIDKNESQEQWLLLGKLASDSCSCITNVYYGPFPSSEAALNYTKIIKAEVNSHPDSRFEILPLFQPKNAAQKGVVINNDYREDIQSTTNSGLLTLIPASNTTLRKEKYCEKNA